MRVLLWGDGNLKNLEVGEEVEFEGYIGCHYGSNNPITVPSGTIAQVLSRQGKTALSGKEVTASTLIELQGKNLPEQYSV